MADLAQCAAAILNPPGHGNMDDRGTKWALDDGGEGLFNTIVPPSNPRYSFACCNFNATGYGCDDGSYFRANSDHPGGANFLFADGHVFSLKSSIAPRTSWALGTRAGGEVISSDQYGADRPQYRPAPTVVRWLPGRPLTPTLAPAGRGWPQAG